MNKYSDKEYKIFSRLFILKEFSEQNLEKLASAHIGIVGMGGIGCPLSLYLVNSGIKKLTLVDGDFIEESNLNRQILFDRDDLGKKKVEVAKEKLKKINSNCVVNIKDKHLNQKNIFSLSNCSIIVDATDDWKTSKFLNTYCLENSINFLFSSVIRHDLQIILFNNNNQKKHLCLNCIFPSENEVDLPRCETVGISGISAGLAGLISAQKIINFTLNLRNETNILTISDGKKLSIDNIIVKSKHECDLKLR